MQKIKKILTSMAVTLLAVGSIGMTQVVPAYAAPADDACAGIRAAGGTCDATNADARFGSLVRTVITILSIIVGAFCVIMIIIGGFRYVVSGGDSNATKGAKDTIMYAVIGLVVVIFAQIIVSFVFSQANKGVTTPTTPPAAPGSP